MDKEEGEDDDDDEDEVDSWSTCDGLSHSMKFEG